MTLDYIIDRSIKKGEEIFYKEFDLSLADALNLKNKTYEFGIDTHKHAIDQNTTIVLGGHGARVNGYHKILIHNEEHTTEDYVTSLCDDIGIPIHIMVTSCYSGSIIDGLTYSYSQTVKAGTSIVTYSSNRYTSLPSADNEDVLSIIKYANTNKFINLMHSILLTAELDIRFLFICQKKQYNYLVAKRYEAKIPSEYATINSISVWQREKIKSLKEYFVGLNENCDQNIYTTQIKEAIEYIENNQLEIDIIQKDNIDRIRELLFISHVNQNNVAAVQKFIAAGINVNMSLPDGITPLYVASEQGYTSLVKMLLEGGADVDKRRIDNVTSLHMASQQGHLSIVKMLLKYNADVDSLNNQDMTPLYTAVLHGHKPVVQELIAYGSDVNQANYRGVTPLYVASNNNDISLVKMLLDNGANVDQADDRGITPLYRVSYKGYTSIVKLLLNNGADVKKQNIDDFTPLDIASAVNNTDIIKLLQDSIFERAMNAEGEIITIAKLVISDKEYNIRYSYSNSEKEEVIGNNIKIQSSMVLDTAADLVKIMGEYCIASNEDGNIEVYHNHCQVPEIQCVQLVCEEALFQTNVIGDCTIESSVNLFAI